MGQEQKNPTKSNTVCQFLIEKAVLILLKVQTEIKTNEEAGLGHKGHTFSPLGFMTRLSEAGGRDMAVNNYLLVQTLCETGRQHFNMT